MDYFEKIFSSFDDINLFIFNLILKVVNERLEPKISAEHSAFMLILEPGKCILEISIGKNEAHFTGSNQRYITKLESSEK